MSVSLTQIMEETPHDVISNLLGSPIIFTSCSDADDPKVMDQVVPKKDIF
jgi:hypothetical protein